MSREHRTSAKVMQTTAPAQTNNVRYIVQSSDVLDRFRVNILEEGSQKILWYKERHINEREIVESVTDNTTKSVRWTIHKPRDGWYLRLRSPTFPPNVSISLIPPPPSPKPSQLPTTNSPSIVKPEDEGSLTFIVRTLPQIPTHELSTSNHCYPPSPSTVQPPPATTTTITTQPPAQLNNNHPKSNKTASSTTQNTSITRFLLSPSIPSPVLPTAGLSVFLNRALAIFSPPIRARVSFYLTPVYSPGETSSPPLLSFVEQTSTFSVATAGTLTIDKAFEQKMGVETAFWVAVSLAYLEFLSDRDSYLAAANG